jgi:Family of unknown function (DUF5681)
MEENAMHKKAKPRGNPTKIVPFQWKPGQSGNPKGRPRKEPLTDILRAVLAEKVPHAQDPRQSQLAHVLIRNWVLEAIRTKDTSMITEIFNRIEGKVKDRFELGGEEGEPIRIQRVDVKRLTDEELADYEKLIRKATDPRSDA